MARAKGNLVVNPMKSDRSQVRDLKGQVSLYGREVVPLIREVLASGGSFDLTVSGTSMSPTLKPERDQVRLKAPQRKMPEKYPILFFQRDDGTYVLHRKIRGGRQGLWVINGDAQAWTERIQPGQVIGVVYEIRRKGRWIPVRDKKYRLWVFLWRRARILRPMIFRVKRGLNCYIFKHGR